MAQTIRDKFLSLLNPGFSKSLSSKIWKNNTQLLKLRMSTDELTLWTSLTLLELKVKRTNQVKLNSSTASYQLDLNVLTVTHPKNVRMLHISPSKLSRFLVVLQLEALAPMTLVANFPNLHEIVFNNISIKKQEVETLHAICNSYDYFKILSYTSKNWLAEKASVKCFLESKNFLTHKNLNNLDIFEPDSDENNVLTIDYEREALYFNLHLRNPRNRYSFSHVQDIHLYIPRNSIYLLLSTILNSSLRLTLNCVRINFVKLPTLVLPAVSFLREFIVSFTEMRYFCLGRMNSMSYLCHYIFVERANVDAYLELYTSELSPSILRRRHEYVLNWHGERFSSRIPPFSYLNDLRRLLT